MNVTPAYTAWSPRRLPERQNSADSSKFFSSRPPTPLFGREQVPREGPSAPQMRRADSDSSLLAFHLEAPGPSRPPLRRLHERTQSFVTRVPLPQGVSLTVAAVTALAFGLSITTLVIGLHNRTMLTAATEARHDPHGPLANMIYTVVVHALKANLTGPPGPPPFDAIVPDPN